MDIYVSNFHPLVVVVRGNETQFQVGEILNFIAQRFNPFQPEFIIVILIHYKPPIAVAILDL